MSIERTREAMNRYWDSQHQDLSMMAEDVLFTHMATGDEPRGPDAVRKMLDYIYSRSDLMWREMGMLTKLHNLWVNWLVEYDDGSYEGGYAWRGRPGNGFAAAHHCLDGVSTARADARMETERTDRGTITRVRLTLGDELEVVLDQLGSLDWPLHTVGTVSSTSRGKQIVKSWNYTEYFPLNWPAVAEYQQAHRSLFGRYPSFQRLMADARIVDEHLVFPERR